jgi:hypothetical protein
VAEEAEFSLEPNPEKRGVQEEEEHIQQVQLHQEQPIKVMEGVQFLAMTAQTVLQAEADPVGRVLMLVLQVEQQRQGELVLILVPHLEQPLPEAAVAEEGLPLEVMQLQQVMGVGLVNKQVQITQAEAEAAVAIAEVWPGMEALELLLSVFQAQERQHLLVA